MDGQRRRIRGLSTADVMVCLVVMVLLSVLLFAYVLPERERANRTKCLSNQKIIATGLALYASDSYFGRMPPCGPMGRAGGLYDGGSGIVGDEAIFRCPSVESGRRHPDGDYARDIVWDLPENRPSKVIIGDFGGFSHHGEVAVVTFRDGHCLITDTLDHVRGAADAADNIYNNKGDPVASTTRSCLTVRD